MEDRPRLLVVDGDAATLQQLSSLLRHILPSGYTLTLARDGAEAADLLGKNAYDLVLTSGRADVALPAWPAHARVSKPFQEGELRAALDAARGAIR